ncbi:hypothetical protein ECC02_001451 [Trypanosoma cruzi]|uniref:Uncharacterized protein n=1 Tax=Trypanosoma cruzi TaxID=5693 RepID=A0A7J6YET0_TRYCR|nr:hypothetical protein ECC02_001451 [Trypanosoma cruzi]
MKANLDSFIGQTEYHCMRCEKPALDVNNVLNHMWLAKQHRCLIHVRRTTHHLHSFASVAGARQVGLEILNKCYLLVEALGKCFHVKCLTLVPGVHNTGIVMRHNLLDPRIILHTTRDGLPHHFRGVVEVHACVARTQPVAESILCREIGVICHPHGWEWKLVLCPLVLLCRFYPYSTCFCFGGHCEWFRYFSGVIWWQRHERLLATVMVNLAEKCLLEVVVDGGEVIPLLIVEHIIRRTRCRDMPLALRHTCW